MGGAETSTAPSARVEAGPAPVTYRLITNQEEAVRVLSELSGSNLVGLDTERLDSIRDRIRLLQVETRQSGLPPPGLEHPGRELHQPGLVGRFFHVTRPEELDSVVRFLGGAECVAVDFETLGLDPHQHAPRLLSLSVDGFTFVVDLMACAGWVGALRPVLSNPRMVLVAHNAKFEAKFMLRAGIAPTRFFCTQLASQVIDGGQHIHEKDYFRLEPVADRELGIHLDKSLQTSDWSAAELTDEQLRYAGRDTAVLLELREKLEAKLAVDDLNEVAGLEFSALPAVAWLELSGAPFDRARWSALAAAAAARVERLREEALALFRPVLRAGTDLNLNSPVQLRNAFKKLGVDVENTREATLALLVGSHPAVRKLLEYRQATKLATTYGEGFLEHVHPATTRIHAGYRQIGTVTGRMSCSGPNLQNVPDDPEYRGCFAPREGRKIVKADLSLVEMCVAAEITGDERMIEAITAGDDLHRITAEEILEKSVEAPEERKYGKRVNFGFSYGMGLRGLKRTSAEFGIAITDSSASILQRRFAAAWPTFWAWRCRRLAETGSMVRTAARRIRRLEASDPGTIRVNTPIQGTAADGFKMALALMWQTRERCPSAVPVLAVHDELVIECDAAEAKEAAAWVVECLQTGMEAFIKRVPVRVEVEVAASWASI
jgi:DNA polymerase I-like protein with 3'-5' exonuclease and polymerase domains